MNEGYWSDILRQRLSRRRALAGAATLGTAALVVAACGGDDEKKTGAKTEAKKDASGYLYQPTDTSKQGVKGGIAVFPGFTEGQGFDPNIGDDRVQAQTQHSYQRLLSWKLGNADDLPTGEVIGGAAQSWEQSKDGLQFTLKLRPDNKFDQRPPTNSRALNSEDVKFSWDRFKATNLSRSDVINSINKDAPIDSVTFPDSSTVVFKLAYPTAAISAVLAFSWFLNIMPVEADGKFDTKQEMRGTGPFMLTKFTPSVGWEYRRNPNFYMKDRPFLDGIDYPQVLQFPVQLAQFKAKRLWRMAGLGGPGGIAPAAPTPPNDLVLDVRKDNPDAQMIAIGVAGRATQSSQVFAFSKLETSPFNDVRIRQAASMLVDRDAWLDAAYNVSPLEKAGLAMDVRWSSHSPATWPESLDPKTSEIGEGGKYFQLNPDEAAKLLRAAGKFGMEAPLHHAPAGQGFFSPTTVKWIEIIKQMLEVGGHFKLKTELHDYLNDYNPNIMAVGPDAGRAKWEGMAYLPSIGVPDYDLWMWSCWAPSGRNAYIGHSQWPPNIRDLMTKIRRETDVKKRLTSIHDFQKAMAVNTPAIHLPGYATLFDFNWPWLSSFGYHRSWNNQSAAADVDIHHWYDKSKDTRTG
ncbi:MAG TPA: ABC transporter substrate-binding protein [Dehalococcoidia bacterium]|nr:ABC transporter substrate-binding protein [Dehalococcoidia bacterium]